MSDEIELSGLGRTGGARNSFVQDLMDKTVVSGKCAFCPKSFRENNADFIEPIDGVNLKQWNVWNNPSPLDGTKHHFLAAPIVHVLDSTRLSSEAMQELEEIQGALQNKYRYASYSLVSRKGRPDFNSATVYHLHYHIMVSSGDMASLEAIAPEYLQQVQIAYEIFGQNLESLDKFREAIDVFRAAKLGKAVPIRPKVSNKAGRNLLE